MSKPDILIYMSDQHTPNCIGSSGHRLVQTPNIDDLVSAGVSFDSAYTACPLCVPARSAFLTAQLPSVTGIFTNQDAIAENQSTFIHKMALEGYETVLCGRMHFMGSDQRHGFTKRIMPDITADHWGTTEKMSAELGVFDATLSMNGCLKFAGSGDSPVLAYDRAVIKAALDYLAGTHEKPQCIVIGTYGPHFPYVGEPELFERYYNRIDDKALEDYEKFQLQPCLSHKMQSCEKDKLKAVRAAYMSMVQTLDRQLGAVHESWKAYLSRRDRKGVFIYTSDHGDQVGERKLFGKQTFYENSARIPLVFEGNSIAKGHRSATPVSIMDIGPTVLDIAEAGVMPFTDGRSLKKAFEEPGELKEANVFSEYVDQVNGIAVPCRMLRHGQYKLITYDGYQQYDQLFDLVADPLESDNLMDAEPEIYKEMVKVILKDWSAKRIKERYDRNQAAIETVRAFGRLTDKKSKERWHIIPEATELPDVPYER